MTHKLAILFPGQGSQGVGMGRSLCDTFGCARSTFDEAAEALGFDIRKLCWDSSLEELTRTENAQPAILTVSVSWYRVLEQEFDIRPEFLAGHSLGEFSAIVCSGALRFDDALKLVRKRGLFMQQAMASQSGSMTAIGGITFDQVQEECIKAAGTGRVVAVSCMNTQDQTVISGHSDAVAVVENALSARGARVASLKVSAPFHCSLMEPAARKLEVELQAVQVLPLKISVVSNVTARPYLSSKEIGTLLTQQMTEPVRWEPSMRFLAENGVTLAIESGPGMALRNMMRRIAKQMTSLSSDQPGDYQNIKAELGSKDPTALKNLPKTLGSPDKMKVLTRSLAIAVCTRNTNWDNDQYQAGVVGPYRKIEQLLEELEGARQIPSTEQARQGLEMLRSVFLTKKTPVEEQIERFEQIFNETGTADLFRDFELPRR